MRQRRSATGASTWSPTSPIRRRWPSAPSGTNERTAEGYLAQIPPGRRGTVDDMAAAVRSRAGPESSWIPGQILNVDGGHTLRRGPDLGPLLGVHFEKALNARLGS